MDVSIFAVFVAGLASFLSPCVLPLVPGYVSMLSGIGVDQLKEDRGPRGGLVASAVAFVVGFSVVFIAFGASASAIGSFLVRNRALLAPIAGAMIILFGLHLIGWLVKISIRVGFLAGVVLILLSFVVAVHPIPHVPVTGVDLIAVAMIFVLGPGLTRWLNRDVHLRNVGGNQPGMVSGFLMGFAFAFGWTPCIGPILATVLAIAATKQTVGQGILLLTFYSAGLAIPFLATALGIGRFLKFYQKFRRHLHTVEVCSGILLLIIGALIFTDSLTRLSGGLGQFSLDPYITKWFGLPAPTAPSSPTPDAASASNLQDEPPVTFLDLQGTKVPLASYKGKVVVVNFWATWCDPCFAEIPSLIQLQQKYGDKDFTMLGVAMDDEGQKVVAPFVQGRKFAVAGQQIAMNYPIVIGNDDISTQFGGLIGYPTTFVISRDGKVDRKYLGSLNIGDLEKEIQRLM
jgi:cytochrome c-type biogenesis protein